MTERKFTDEEVIKALEICQKAKCWGDCEDMGCPAASRQGCRFYLRTDEDYEGVIQDEMLKDALDLIMRQRANLQEVITLNSKLEAKNAELQRLLDFYEETSGNKKAKAEAIKEFAERLKAYGRKNLTDTDSMHFGIIITNVLKELTETPCTEGADCSTCEYCYHDGGYNECAVDGIKPN